MRRLIKWRYVTLYFILSQMLFRAAAAAVATLLAAAAAILHQNKAMH